MQLTKEDIKKMEKVGDSAKGDIYHILTKGGLNMIIQKSLGGEMRVLGRGVHRAFARHQAEQLERIQWNEDLWKNGDPQKDDWIGEKYYHPQTGKLMGTPSFKDQKIESVHYSPEEHDTIKQQRTLQGLDPHSGRKLVESNPQNHYDLAAHHSKMAGRYAQQEKEARAVNPSQNMHDLVMNNLMHSDYAMKHYKMSGLDPKGANDEHKKQMMLHHELKEDAPPHVAHDLEIAWQRANPGKRAPSGLGYRWTE